MGSPNGEREEEEEERGEEPLFNAILEGQNEKNLVLEHRQPRNTIKDFY